MENQNQNRVYLPIIFLFSWLCFTILVFILGPWKYKLTQSFIFYSYLFLVNMALLIGYILGQKEVGSGSRLKVDYHRFVEITITVSVVYLIIKLLFSKGGDISNLIGTFRNTAETYANSSVKHAYLFSYLDILFTPISVIAITNSIFCYTKLKKYYRYAVYFMILVLIASSIGSATRAGIIQLILISFAAFLLSIYQKNIVIKYYHKVFILLTLLVFTFGFLMYSNLLTNKRGGLHSVNAITFEPPKENYFLYKVVPDRFHLLINSTSFYISHSYYRLNRALNLPFLGLGFGLSNSYFIMDNIEEVTGWSGLKNISYGMRLDNEDGTIYGNFWSTFYTWIASDFTFPGTIIVVLFIGYLLSIALRDSLYNLNPLSVTSFCTLFFFIFSFAFNNPLQDGAGITTNLFIPVLWIIFRKGSAVVNNKII